MPDHSDPIPAEADRLVRRLIRPDLNDNSDECDQRLPSPGPWLLRGMGIASICLISGAAASSRHHHGVGIALLTAAFLIIVLVTTPFAAEVARVFSSPGSYLYTLLRAGNDRDFSVIRWVGSRFSPGAIAYAHDRLAWEREALRERSGFLRKYLAWTEWLTIPLVLYFLLRIPLEALRLEPFRNWMLAGLVIAVIAFWVNLIHAMALSQSAWAIGICGHALQRLAPVLHGESEVAVAAAEERGPGA